MAVDKNKLTASAQKHAQRGNLDRAIKDYRAIVDSDPGDVRIWLKIGDLYTRKGSLTEAMQTYGRVAAVYESQGIFLKAVSVYKQMLGVFPGHLETNRKLADAYVKLNLPKDAIQQYQVVVGQYEREGDHQKSVQLLEKMVQIAPNDEGNRMRLAEAYGREKQSERAIAEFGECLSLLLEKQQYETYSRVAERLLYLYPKEFSCAKKLSEIYLRTNLPKKALAWLQVLFRQDPMDTETLELLGTALAGIGQTGKALSVYRELARVQGEAGHRSEERKAYEKILSLDPSDAQARHVLSQNSGPQMTATAMSDESQDDSLGSGDSESSLSPEQQIALYVSDADLLIKYSLVDHARMRCEKALSLDPHNVEVLTRLKELSARQNRTEETIQILNTLIGITRNRDVQVTRGYLMELLRLQPENPDARNMLQELGRGRTSMPPGAVKSSLPERKQANSTKATAPVSNMDEVRAAAEQIAQRKKRKRKQGLDLNIDLGDLEDLPDDSPQTTAVGADRGSVSMQDLSASLSGDLGFDVDLETLAPPPDDDEFGDLLVDGPDESVEAGPPIIKQAAMAFKSEDIVQEPPNSSGGGSQGRLAQDGGVLVPPPVPTAAQRSAATTKETPVVPLVNQALIPPAPPHLDENENVGEETIDGQDFSAMTESQGSPKTNQNEPTAEQSDELEFFSINMDMDFGEGAQDSELTLESMSVDLNIPLRAEDEDDLVLGNEGNEGNEEPTPTSQLRPKKKDDS